MAPTPRAAKDHPAPTAFPTEARGLDLRTGLAAGRLDDAPAVFFFAAGVDDLPRLPLLLPVRADAAALRGVETVRVVREDRGFAPVRGADADDLVVEFLLVELLDVDALVLDSRALDLPAMASRLVGAIATGPSATPATACSFVDRVFEHPESVSIRVRSCGRGS
ncbi:hypothetical protein ABH922_001640 [Rhodococcus sp. 27YEA15]|uniref:hypothetical protein n=1 Tax=Rhodococcus sp. 27YEA15 TaxID=3156259 RepID=UPI003C7C49D0